jgi:hypothetical protein
MLIGFRWLTIGTAPDTYEQYNELFDSINGREFIEHVREYQFLELAFAPLTNQMGCGTHTEQSLDKGHDNCRLLVGRPGFGSLLAIYFCLSRFGGIGS